MCKVGYDLEIGSALATEITVGVELGVVVLL